MRVKQIDALRGVAALIVTFFHLTGSSGLSKTTASYGSYGWTGVQLFFVISGFVLPYSLYSSGYTINSFFKFLAKRWLRIYPAYLAAIVIGVVLAALTHRTAVTINDILLNMAFLNDVFAMKSISPVFWTLVVELQFYILIALFYPIVIKSNYYSLIFILILTITGIWILPVGIFSWFAFFALGILIFHRFFTAMPSSLFWMGTMLLMGVIIYTKGILCAVAASFAVVFILFFRIDTSNAVNKIFLGLGTISYSLYLVHWEIGRAAISTLKRFPLIENAELFKVFVGLVISIFSAYIMYRFIEKPSLKLSSKLKYKPGQ